MGWSILRGGEARQKAEGSETGPRMTGYNRCQGEGEGKGGGIRGHNTHSLDALSPVQTSAEMSVVSPDFVRDSGFSLKAPATGPGWGRGIGRLRRV